MVIKNLRNELTLLFFILILLFFYDSLDIGINKILSLYSESFSGKHLKQFFINITILGDSLWYFLSSITLLIFSFLFRKKILNYKKIQTGLLFFLVGIFLTGALTQIIKHVIGRPRPRYVNENIFFDFNFFTLESSFHSFPSGHTSTIFFVAIMLSAVTPKLKYFYFIFAMIVGLSRMIVGAHFFLDVLGGIIISFIAFKITLVIFKYLKTDLNWKFNGTKNYYIFFQYLFVLFIFIIFLTLGSSLDIYISAFAYLGEQQFLLQSNFFITIFFRKFLLPFLIVYLVVLPPLSLYFPIKKIYFNYKFKVKECVFIFCSMFFNLIIVVNLLLKNLWGRARPNDTLNFGGVESFTPWFKFSSACSSNCSFVSGDASVGFSLIILYFLTKNKMFLYFSLIFGFSLGLIRISEGGHFLSDILIANLLIFILFFVQYYFYDKKIIKHVS